MTAAQRWALIRSREFWLQLPLLTPEPSPPPVDLRPPLATWRRYCHTLRGERFLVGASAAAMGVA